jgi:hypothetical protein
MSRYLFAAVWAVLGWSFTARAFTLVENGRSEARIYFLEDAPQDVRDAAVELARVFEKMTGAALPLVPLVEAGALDPKAPGLVLGDLARTAGLALEGRSRAGDGFRYKVRGRQVLIVGENPAGVYTGAMRFLESLGCGWFTPGEVGEVIPSVPTVAIPDDTDRTEFSDSINRRFWYGGKNGNGAATDAWLRRLNGGNFQSGSWNHAYAGLVSKETLEKHPEYGSLNRGVRTGKQLCTSNPDVIRTAAESLLKRMASASNTLVFAAGPNDGGNLCECEVCARLDTPGYLEPSSGKPACSDRIFQFAADIAAITAKTYPQYDLGILVYSEYSRIPLKIAALSPNVFPMIAPIRRCRIHGPGNPICEMNMLWKEEILGWSKLGPKLGFYVYNYNLADTLMPFSKADFYRRLLATLAETQVDQLAWIFETIDSWSMMAPYFYLSVRISWNRNLDVDRELDRFHRGFYGAAYEPMKRYWTRLDEVYANTPSHTGSSYGMHKFWTPETLRACRADLDAAAKAAATPREKQAVALAEAGLRCAELYMTIWTRLAECDFAAALKTQNDLEAHVAMMAAQPDPHWAHDRYAFKQYYKRFVGLTVESGATILAGGGKVVARLPEVWKFALDEKAVGAAEGWFKPDFDDSAWREMGTMSTSWADEGMPWYQGDAWYRARVSVPAEFKGRDLRLWFGGFDNNVDVYVNGRHLGEKTGFVKPQEFEGLADALVFDKPNVVAVRVSAGGLAEIGTGGIMMPVMIYAAPDKPAAPGDGKPAAPQGPTYEM